MAVAKMLNLKLIAHNNCKDSLVKSLQENGLLEIKTKIISKNTVAEEKKHTEDLHLFLNDINSSIDFLEKQKSEKKGFFASLIPSKIPVNKSELSDVVEKIKSTKVLENINNIEIDYQSSINILNEKKSLLDELRPWKNLKIIPGKISKHTIFNIASISTSKLGDLTDYLQKNISYSDIKIISNIKSTTYISIIYHEVVAEKIKKACLQFGANTINLVIDNDPGLEHKNTLKEIENLDKHIKNLNKKIEKINKLKSILLIAKESVTNQINKVEIEQNFSNTRNTFFLEGWVSEKQKNNIVNLFNSISNEIEYNFTEPSREDSPPIILENPRWLIPLESVTKLYGYPNYWEKDPTPYLAFFFLLFFGISIGDVGYGITIALLAWLLMKKLNVSENSKQFLKLFIYGGIASIIPGIITGSWFAISINKLPTILQKMIFIDPLADPMLFMIVCFILGFIHLYLGVIIKLLNGFRDNVAGSLLENVPVLIFLPGFAMIIALIFFSQSGITPEWAPFAKWLALIGSASIVLFTNWKGKNIFSKIGGGLYNLYGMSAYIGDTISYARLMALGLATFLIGQAINTMAILFYTVFGPVFGLLVALLVIIIGHLFNIVINLIGAFIHPARLQYVEFFTKFFEGGGKPFKPFKYESKTLKIN